MGFEDLQLQLEYWCEQKGINVLYAYIAIAVVVLLVLASLLFLVPWGNLFGETEPEPPPPPPPPQPEPEPEPLPPPVEQKINPKITTYDPIVTQADVNKEFTFDLEGTKQKIVQVTLLSSETGGTIYDKRNMGWRIGTDGKLSVKFKITQTIFDDLGSDCNEISIIIDGKESPHGCIFAQKTIIEQNETINETENETQEATNYTLVVLKTELNTTNYDEGFTVTISPAPPSNSIIYAYVDYGSTIPAALGRMTRISGGTMNAIYEATVSESNFKKFLMGCNNLTIKIDGKEFGPDCLYINNTVPSWYELLSVSATPTTITAIDDEIELSFKGPPNEKVDLKIETSIALRQTYDDYVELDSKGMEEKTFLLTRTDFLSTFTSNGKYNFVPYLADDAAFENQGVEINLNIADECAKPGIDKKCVSQEKFVICTDQGDWNMWGETPNSCNGQVCVGGVCADGPCTDVCTLGSYRCNADKFPVRYEMCIEGENGCAYWEYDSSFTNCISEKCYGNVAKPRCYVPGMESCDDECIKLGSTCATVGKSVLECYMGTDGCYYEREIGCESPSWCIENTTTYSAICGCDKNVCRDTTSYYSCVNKQIVKLTYDMCEPGKTCFLGECIAGSSGCISDAQCYEYYGTNGGICSGGKCVECTSAKTTYCDVGDVCDPSSNTCVECYESRPGCQCDTSTNRCIEVYECTGTLSNPSRMVRCGNDEPLNKDFPISLIEDCDGSFVPCSYMCDHLGINTNYASAYYKQGTQCLLSKCSPVIGLEHARFCTGDGDSLIPMDSQLVNTCTERKCEYVCEDGYYIGTQDMWPGDAFVWKCTNAPFVFGDHEPDALFPKSGETMYLDYQHIIWYPYPQADSYELVIMDGITSSAVELLRDDMIHGVFGDNYIDENIAFYNILEKGKTYYYWITAYDGSKDSKTLGPVSFKVLECATGKRRCLSNVLQTCVANSWVTTTNCANLSPPQVCAEGDDDTASCVVQS